MKRAAAVLLALGLGCGPGIEVEIANDTDRRVRVTRIVDWESTERRVVLEPHTSANVGRAVAWFVEIGSVRHELPHPGLEFAGRSLTSNEVYRFEIAPDGCIFVLSPGDDATRPTQPPGYPLGPETCATAPEPSSREP